MTVTSAAWFRLIIIAAISNRVTAWTIDLPEVRRYYFERYDSRAHVDDDASKNDRGGRSFDNINGGSLHSMDELTYYNNLHGHQGVDKENGKDYNTYANNFNNYESYMVRKVQTTLNNGTEYLDGLRRSIERYIELLKNCSRITYSTELPPEMTSPLSIGEFSGLRDFSSRCQEATRDSEHVRRLAQLALHTTRRLQDVAYTSKYSKDDSMEENELLLRLAWYLDKLAALTGYDPDPHAHTTPSPPASQPALPSPLPLPELSEETKAAILSCLRSNGSEPATERCSFRVPQPALREMVRRFGLNESSFRLDIPLPTRVSRQSNDNISGPSLDPELLLATDNKHVLPPKPPVTVKVVRKRSISDSANPLVRVLKYYAKHKVWTSSNPVTENPEDGTRKIESLDVKNSLHSMHKRSVDFTTKINKLPEDPMQDLSKYLKSKPNIHYNVDRDAAKRLKAALEAIRSKKLLSRNKIKKLAKILRNKRAVPIEHVRETIKTNTDIHYDIPKDIKDKLKAVIHTIPGSLAHLHEHHPHIPHLDHHHEHIPHLDVHHHGHHGLLDVHHHAHPHGHVEHIIKDIKTDFHYDNIHKEAPAEKIKAAIHNLHAKKVVLVKKIENLRKIFRPKRSVSERSRHNHFEGVVKPRIPENPQGDISYYVKSKPGTNFNRNLGQAALLRLSLEEVFQRGNINVVHKYGSNFNPAVPLPFYAVTVEVSSRLLGLYHVFSTRRQILLQTALPIKLITPSTRRRMRPISNTYHRRANDSLYKSADAAPMPTADESGRLNLKTKRTNERFRF